MPEKTVKIEDLVVSCSGRNILGPLSLGIKKGEFLGVVGPNGAGKTTFLRSIVALQSISKGWIKVFGKRPGKEIKIHELKRKIGFLPQHHDFSPDLPFSVQDIVMFGRIPYLRLGASLKKSDFAAVDKAINTLNLECMRKRLYRELSGGEKQKTQLARLLAQGAELILLDEPTAGLDLEWQERITSIIGDIHSKTGRTVVMVTHGVDHLPPCCDKVLFLKGGQILAEGKYNDIIRPEVLSRLYDCRMEVLRRGERFYAFSVGGGVS